MHLQSIRSNDYLARVREILQVKICILTADVIILREVLQYYRPETETGCTEETAMGWHSTVGAMMRQPAHSKALAELRKKMIST